MGRRQARESLPPFSLPITPSSRRARYAKTTGDESGHHRLMNFIFIFPYREFVAFPIFIVMSRRKAFSPPF